jgi:hypothetical protein
MKCKGKEALGKIGMIFDAVRGIGNKQSFQKTKNGEIAKIFKLAQFMSNIEKRGMDDKTAMKLAQESYVNYLPHCPNL